MADGSSISNTATYTNYGYRMQLENGMTLAVVGNSNAKNTSSILFLIDTNGNTSPNLLGYDIFYFVISQGSNSSDQYYGNNPNIIAGNWSDTSQFRILTQNNCTLQSSESCAQKIMNNGWKIPDNYPIKF